MESAANKTTITIATAIAFLRWNGWRTGERSMKGKAKSKRANPPGTTTVPMTIKGPLKIVTS